MKVGLEESLTLDMEGQGHHSNHLDFLFHHYLPLDLDITLTFKINGAGRRDRYARENIILLRLRSRSSRDVIRWISFDFTFILTWP